MRTLSLLIALLIASASYGQTIAEYKSELSKKSTIAKKVSSVSTYSKWEVKNKTTGKLSRFDDMPESDKRIFALFKTLELEGSLRQLQRAWEISLKKLETDFDDGSEDEEETEQAKRLHIRKALQELLKIRGRLARDSEATMEKLFADFPEAFGEKERALSLRELKKSHDKEKLISR